MRPREALLELLYERGVERLASIKCELNRRFWRDPFQETAVHMLVKDTKINLKRGVKSRRWFPAEVKGKEVWYMLRGGEELSDATHEASGEISREDLLPMLDELPYVGVYLGFVHLHTPKELRKLNLQLWETLNAVRYFLWDAHLVLLEKPPNFEWRPNEYVKVMSMENLSTLDYVILFDPNAPEVIKPEEILRAEAFIFGGIVDKEVPRPGLTSKIPCDFCIRRRIELWGSLAGVPLMIHKLAYAVLRARFELNGDIEKALIEVMGSRERRWRMAKEAIEAYKRGEDPVERVLKVAKLLGSNINEVIEALKMSGIEGGRLARKVQAEYSGEN